MARNSHAAQGAAVPPLKGELPPPCRRDLNELCRFVHATVAREAPTGSSSPVDFNHVLLTGATGFVGRFFLRELLEQNEGVIVHCLVRADTAELGLERICNALKDAEIWDEKYTERLRVLIGDIRQERFGLPMAIYDELCRQLDAVYHIAGDVKLVSSYADIRGMNTLCLRSVLDLCFRTRLKHLFYASTMGVFPEYFCNFANEFSQSSIGDQMQPDLSVMKRIFPVGMLGYPWSKLVSEQILLFARSAGLPVAIFRLPSTRFASNGFVKADEITTQLFYAVAGMNVAPTGFSPHEINEPVDTLARICTAISNNPQRKYVIYHCCDPQPAYEEYAFDDFGLYWKKVPYGAFKRACLALGERSPLHGTWPLLDYVSPYWFSERSAVDGRPITDRTIHEDCPQTIKWPTVLERHSRCHNWVIRKQEEWPYQLPDIQLNFGHLMERAGAFAKNEGIPFEAAYPDWMQCGIKRLVQALNSPKSDIKETGKGQVAFDLSRLLRKNAALAGELHRHPEISRENIVRPVFIVGINRTGTTFLHRLMARGSRFWTLRLFELEEPVLPAGNYGEVAHGPDDPRRNQAESILSSMRATDVFSGVHDTGVDEPDEEFNLLRLAFGAWVSSVMYRVPDYDQWLAENGSREAYRHHRRTMQHYSWQRRQQVPGEEREWLLKMPFHLKELDVLLETYPDAVFIQTHREPEQSMASWFSLVERIRSLSTNIRSRHELAAEQLAFMSKMLNDAMLYRTSRPELEDRWVDVRYSDLIKDPMKIVNGIYDHFGWPLDPGSVQAMKSWYVRQANQRRREPSHQYKLDDYGLTPESVNDAFGFYREFVGYRGIT